MKPRYQGLFAILTLIATILLSGCGDSDTVSKSERQTLIHTVNWSYASNAVIIQVDTAKDVNQFNKEAHPISLAVVQVSNPNQISALIKTSAGIARLLSTGKTGSSQTAFERFIFQPGESKLLKLKRAEGTQHIYIIAGYAYLTPGNGTVSAHEVPLEVVKKGFIFHSETLVPSVLNLSVSLGADRMTVTDTSDSDDSSFF